MKKHETKQKAQGLTRQQIRGLSNQHANMLKKHSPVYINSLGTFTGAAGGQIRIKLKNVGYITRLFADIKINTTIGTLAATIGPKGLYAAIPRIRFTDFAQNERINCSAFNLFMRNSLRASASGLAGMTYLASNNSVAQNVQGLTSGFTNPNVNPAVGTNDQRLFLEIPVCKDKMKGDLRGMVDANTIEGESYVTFDIASSLFANGNDDFVFNGAATSTVAVNTVSIELFQEYYLPQKVNGVEPHPIYDMSLVYELNGLARTTADLATNTDKLINVMNNRDIRGFYMSYLNNSVLGGSAGNELARFKFLVGGSNYVRDVTERFHQFEQLEKVGITLPKGCYFWDFPNGLETQHYGTSQFVVTPGGTLVSPSIEFMFESFYQIGAPLSSMIQS